MTLANLLMIGLVGVIGLLGGCQSTPTPSAEQTTVETQPIDGISRNISENQEGAVHSPSTLSPPPIRRDFVTDR